MCQSLQYCSQFVCQSVILSVILFVCNSEVAINQVLESSVWAQCDNFSNLIVLDFWIKALFSSCGMIHSHHVLVGELTLVALIINLEDL